jgi:hypothetical protein
VRVDEYQSLGFSERFFLGSHEVVVLGFFPLSDVVSLGGGSLLVRPPDPAAVIVDLDPVADILTVAVDRQRIVVHRVRDHQRN